MLLEVHGVSKSFPGVKALEDMRLDLRAGEVLAVVGENGAGKSTLMKLLTGIYAADEGEFSLNGERYEPTSPKHALELGISIIHQEFNLMPDLTVAQNMFIGREPWAAVFTSERRLNAQAQALIERLHLPLRPKDLVGDLTVAKQQMVEIGKALSYDAKLLIMDEPTAALNDAEVEVLHDLIRRFVRPDTGVIYISHRMDELRRIADRVTVIRDGRYVGTRVTAETTMKEVISMMVGRELSGTAKPVGVRDDREVVLEVSGLCTKDLLDDVSFELRKGEILGFAGLMGAGRTEVARAIVGADKASAGTIRLRGRELRIANPADAAKHRIGYLSEDRKRFGLLLEQEVNANIGLSALGERFQRWGFMRDKAMRATSRAVRRHAADQDAVGRADGQEPLGRQPAEGRHRQVARQGLRRPDLRRADARDRRGRQGGDLPAAERPRGERQVDHHDLVGAARDPAHVAPDRRDERGPRDRHARRRARPRRSSVMHFATLRAAGGGGMSVSSPPRARTRRRPRSRPSAPASATGSSSSSPSRA